MTAGPVNRALLESNFQNPGDVYDDTKTEGAFDVVADQVDDNWNYLAGLVNGGTLIPYPAFMSRQAIINGNFDIWQRGTSFTNPVTAAFTSDHYQISFVNTGTLPTTLTSSRLSITPGDVPNSYFGYRLNTNGSGSGFGANDFYFLTTAIEQGTRYLLGNGNSLYFSFWAKTDISGKKIGINGIQRYGTGGAPSASEVLQGTIITLTSTWTKYTFKFTSNTTVGKTFGTNNDDNIALILNYMWGSTYGSSRFGSAVAETFVGSGNIDIAQIQITASDVVLPLYPKTVQTELQDCLRYTTIPQTNSIFVRMSNFTANTIVFDVPLTVQLRRAPTVLGTANTDIVVNTTAGIAQAGFTFAALLTGNGVRVTATKVAHGLTDANLEIKTTSGFEAEL